MFYQKLLNRCTLFLLPVEKRKAIVELSSILGFYPHNLSLYHQALVHRSCSAELPSHRLQNNERLEFLGDSILGAIVSDILYKHFGDKREGFLTCSRSNLVKRSMLNRLAVEMGLDKLIIVSNDKCITTRNYLCGNAFEALIGAIYLDRGYKVCRHFVEEKVYHRLINMDTEACRELNYKSRLIEWTQKKRLKVSFRTLSETPAEGGNTLFKSCVVVEGEPLAEGEGYTKKESHQQASRRALRRLHSQPQLEPHLLELQQARTTGKQTDQ